MYYYLLIQIFGWNLFEVRSDNFSIRIEPLNSAAMVEGHRLSCSILSLSPAMIYENENKAAKTS